MVDEILNSGYQGIKRGLESAARHAHELSRAFTPEADADPIDSIVGLKADQFQVQASAKVIQVADSLQGSLLDILA